MAATELGWNVKFHCENDKRCRSVLKEKYPNAYLYGDIKKSDFRKFRNRIDVLMGGFPCQPYSAAGKREGKEDDRHLWPEMRRAIHEAKPRYVVGENVRGLINWNEGMVFDEVQSDLEAEGYEVWPFLLPAAGVGAPHERYRIWFIAYATGDGHEFGRFGESRRASREGKSLKDQWEWIWANFGRIGQERIITNTSSNRRKREGKTFTTQEGLQSGSKSAGILERGFKGPCGYGSFTNTSNIELQRSIINRGTRKEGAPEGEIRQFSGSVCCEWEHFPTQPPLCVGDDGFSTELLRQRIREDSLGVISEEEIDKIISKAFNKWRIEAIKSSGNAVVGPLVLQILKTIEKYDNIIHRPINE